MKNSNRVFILFFFIYSNIVAQSTWKWAKGIGGGGEDRANDIAFDSFGNSYTVGYFGSGIAFDTHSLAPVDGYDFFLVKKDFNGNTTWAVSGGGINNEYATSVAVSSNASNGSVTPIITNGTPPFHLSL